MRSEPLLRIDGLSVDFDGPPGRVQVTHDVDLHVGEAEVVAVVGESGSGKSVTAMSVLDLLPGNARRTGSIVFDGEDLLAAPPGRLRAIRGGSIGMIFQEPMTALNPVHSVGAALTEAILAHSTLTRTEVDARAVELLGLVHLPDPERMLARYPHQLSGGQRQRVMIAMAIAAEPRLLIADEPTTALDVTVQAGILDLLLELRDRLGMAVVLITHDMGVVADVADQVVVMQHGRVVESQPVHRLFESPGQEYTRELLAAVPGRTDHDGVPSPDEETELEPEAVGAQGAPHGPVLALSGARVEFRQGWRRPPVVAVGDVDLRVEHGEIVGLVGESGSGKSTLGRVALGLQRVRSGTVDVMGTDLATASRAELREVRRTTSMVFQDPGSSLNPRIPIGWSVTDPLRWSGIERRRSVLRERAAELLERVRLPGSWTDRYPHQLSGGQRQRVGIARAIATSPRFMVADEPTSALDVSVQASVLELLLEIQASMGFSCLFISHDLAVVEQIADRVVVLHQGQIVEQGATNEVLRAPSAAYTRRLVDAVPVPDPQRQRARRAERLLLARG
ncbi:ABC transporter ATP-binding protein [Ruania alkalisoli]|uniref:ABC transporter ATP-binding protein n=1 Tax=Ruania alkalisoli TaxID=2779775 RepID=A0A7M1SU71_9MICO|nr:ABC transporter ATP-binding protein [Ruania alkalisoli]QOR70587.1 ABC transporter ATP-binding protein [Ruania alkalisoli]